MAEDSPCPHTKIIPGLEISPGWRAARAAGWRAARAAGLAGRPCCRVGSQVKRATGKIRHVFAVPPPSRRVSLLRSSSNWSRAADRYSSLTRMDSAASTPSSEGAWFVAPRGIQCGDGGYRRGLRAHRPHTVTTCRPARRLARRSPPGVRPGQKRLGPGTGHRGLAVLPARLPASRQGWSPAPGPPDRRIG